MLTCTMDGAGAGAGDGALRTLTRTMTIWSYIVHERRLSRG